MSSALLALTGVGYLAVLSVSFLVWKARPFIGGLAAICAVAFGRLVQMVVKPPVVERRIPEGRP